MSSFSLFKTIAALTIAISTILFFQSCNKNKVITNKNVAFLNQKKANFEALKIKVPFNVSTPGNFFYVSPNGTKININKSCLRLNGQPVTGEVFLEFYEAFDYKNMIQANKSTMAFNNSGGFEVLETGGQFFIEVTQNGQVLSTECAISMETPFGNSGGMKPGMKAWDGSEDAEGNLTWKEATKWEVSAALERGYVFDVPGFGWFNVDRLYNDPRPKTTINALFPSTYNGGIVYVVLKDNPHSLGYSAGEWPIGLDVYLVFVSGENSNYYWSIKETTLTANFSYAFDPSTIISGTKAQFDSAMNSLH